MSKIMEDRVAAEKRYAVMEAAYKNASRMLKDGKLTLDKISVYSGLSIEEVKELAKELQPSAT